jgi:hypothetical protein
MAGTSNGSSTSSLLLGTALARVIEYMGPGSEDAAKKLLLDYLDRRAIRWRCRYLDIGMNAWTAEAAHQFFWERHDSVVHDVNWPNHRATRSGPVFVPVSAIGARVLAYGPRTVLEAETIQLHWSDILGILQALGLASAPATKSKSAAVTVKTEPVGSPSSVALKPKPSAARKSTQGKQLKASKPKRDRRAPQVELAGELMAIVFPEGGWDDMKVAAVRHQCDLNPRAKEKLRKEGKALPSSRSFKRYMTLARAADKRQISGR